MNPIFFRFFMMMGSTYVANTLVSIYGLDYGQLVDSMKKDYDNVKSHTTDLLCAVSFFVLLYSYPLNHLLIARGCNWIDYDLVMARHMKWPKYGYLFIISMFCLSGGCILQSVLKLGKLQCLVLLSHYS